MPMRLPDVVTSYTSPSSSSSSSYSAAYDWRGLDEHIKRQDAVGDLRDAKFGALYGGDIASSVAAGNKIRDLLKSVNAVAPGTTERDPVSRVNPLVRKTSESSDSSSSYHGEKWDGEQEGAPAKRDVAAELDGAQVMGPGRRLPNRAIA